MMADLKAESGSFSLKAEYVPRPPKPPEPQPIYVPRSRREIYSIRIEEIVERWLAEGSHDPESVTPEDRELLMKMAEVAVEVLEDYFEG